MSAYYYLLIGCLVFLSGSGLAALFWAARTHQFKNMQSGATVIFDDEEPVGRPTDMVLPDTRKRRGAAGGRKR